MSNLSSDEVQQVRDDLLQKVVGWVMLSDGTWCDRRGNLVTPPENLFDPYTFGRLIDAAFATNAAAAELELGQVVRDRLRDLHVPEDDLVRQGAVIVQVIREYEEQTETVFSWIA